MEQTEQEKRFDNELEKAEQDLFDMLMSVILFLNTSGMPMNNVKECISVKVKEAFERYPSLKETYDIDHKGKRWNWSNDELTTRRDD